MPTEYRVLLLSDLHALDDVKKVRTGAVMNYAQGSAPRGLLALCLSSLKVAYPTGIDLILVAGDMTDHAAGGALARVWADLQWLADQLGAPLVATSGNHDYDSRSQQDPLPNKSLMALEPRFPFGDDDTRNKFFAEHHAVYRDDNAVVVTANSAGHHGYVKDGAREHEHGRYSDQLPGNVNKSLAKIAPLPPVRIVLTHHHLNQLPELDYEERGATVGQEDFLRKLAEHGSWAIVHGHKHRGWIQYASGSGDSPPLISASAFSADFGSGTFADKVRHQFHVVTFPLESPFLDPTSDDDSGVTGQFGSIESWTHSDIGWEIADKSEDLPGYSGFGWRANIQLLANRFRRELSSRLTMRSPEVEAFEPRLKYLTFDDLRRLKQHLEAGEPRVDVHLFDDGQIDELSLRNDSA